MTKTFKAHFRPVVNRITGDRFPAETITFTEMPNGNWMSSDVGSMFADEVAERCRRAINWADIKAAHFAMDGFHDDAPRDNTPYHKSDL